MHNEKSLVITICGIVQIIVTFSRGSSMNPRANAPLATQIIASTHSKLCYSSFEDLVAKQQLTNWVKLAQSSAYK